MKEVFGDWVKNLLMFSLLSSIVQKILPGKTYTPYVRIFCGIMMLLSLLQPVFQMTGLDVEMEEILSARLYEIEMEQMENELIRIEENQKDEIKRRYEEYIEKQAEKEMGGK